MIRRFHPSDIPAVNRLHRDVWWPERSPEGWRWLDDNLARRVNGEITGHALALLGKGNPIEPPMLEILDLEALDRDRQAIPALVGALLKLAPALGAAKVRLQVVSESTLRDLGELAHSARREGGWGHCHAAFTPGLLGAGGQDVGGWRPTPFDGDYSFCIRPLPVRASRGQWRWFSDKETPTGSKALA